MEHFAPPVTERYLKGLQAAYAASAQHLDATPDMKETFQRLADFATLSVWPCVPPQKNGCSQPDSDNRSHWPLHDFEDDLQHALFYANAGLYSDAKDRLRRFLRYSLWSAAAVNGAQLQRYCDETESLKVLMTEPEFRKFDESLSVCSRTGQLIADLNGHERATAFCFICFYPASLQKFIACAHEAVDIAVTCFAYRKPQIMVALEGVEKFGDYTLWAELLEHDEVEAVHVVLKSQTRDWLIAYAEAHPRVAAMRAYLAGAAPVTSEEEFEPRYNEMMACVSRSAGG